MVGPYHAYVTEYPPVYEVAGYDFVSRLEIFRPFDGERKQHSFRRADGLYTIGWDAARSRIEIARDGKTLATIPVAPLLTRAREHVAAHGGAEPRALPQEVLTLRSENDAVRVKAVFDDVSARECGASPCVYHFKADVMVGTKRAAEGRRGQAEK